MGVCECLNGLVGLRALCDPGTECSLYIDDLYGVSRSAFENLTTTEQKTVEDVFAAVERSAIQVTKTEALSRLVEKFGKRLAATEGISSQFPKDCTAIPLADELAGLYFPLYHSPYHELFVKSVRIRTQAGLTSHFYVFDMFTFDHIETIEWTVTQAGYHEIEIGKTYNSKDGIFFAYDRRVVESCNTEKFNPDLLNTWSDWYYYYYNDPDIVYDYGYYSGYGYKYYHDCRCKASCKGCLKVSIDNGLNLSTEPFDFFQLHPGDLTNDSECGISVCYEARCSYERLVCENIALFPQVLWWQMGIAFFMHPIITKNVNYVTLMTREERTFILDYFKDEFEKALNVFAAQIQQDGACFECRDGLSIVTHLPG